MAMFIATQASAYDSTLAILIDTKCNTTAEPKGSISVIQSGLIMFPEHILLVCFRQGKELLG